MIENFKIAVIGSGTMGNGIAHTAAQSGFKTLLIDINKAQLDKALSTIDKNLDSLILSVDSEGLYDFELLNGTSSISNKVEFQICWEMHNYLLQNTEIKNNWELQISHKKL